eukprot:486078-Alexandrium_andersonii.AAC.1
MPSAQNQALELRCQPGRTHDSASPFASTERVREAAALSEASVAAASRCRPHACCLFAATRCAQCVDAVQVVPSCGNIG